jgi:SOS-response transcriptional repressor LexA
MTRVYIRTADREQTLLDAIALFWRQHGYAPTLRELCALADLSSTSLAVLYLERLEARGLVAWEKKIARTIRLVKDRQP